MDRPSQIFNCDASGFADKTDTKKVIVANPTKFPYKKQGGTGGKSFHTVLFCVSASGVVLPPYIIYKAKNLYSDWYISGAGYNTSESGWMEESTFYERFKHFFIPPVANTTPKLILLILDEHSYHHSVRTIELTTENDIVLLCLPPNSTRILQPLDVAFFKPIKQKYREILDEYYQTSQHNDISKKVFPTLINKLFQSPAVRKVNIIKSFMNAGIYPLDKTFINSQKILKCNQQIEADITAATSDQHMTAKADFNTSLMDRSVPSESNSIINKIPSLNTSVWDHKDSLSNNQPEDVILQINTSVWDHDLDAPLDLSRPTTSTIALSSPLSPITAIRNSLRSLRPVIADQPPSKRIALHREAGQLLKTEQALEQMKEIEERGRKEKALRKKPVLTSSTPKRSAGKPKPKKKVCIMEDLLKDIDDPPVSSSEPFTSTTSTISRISTNQIVTASPPTTCASLLNIPKSSYTDPPSCVISSAPYNIP
ncbi:unnamed protein product, partial [Didymodactylos carnosus]